MEPDQAQPQALSVGVVVGGTYEVTRLLGKGGMGSVWEAAHLRLPGKKVAIKVLHADAAADGESLLRFRREAEIASRLGHPNIVEVHDFNLLPSGQPYLVLELLRGESLDQRIRRGPIPPEHAVWIAGQIASALAAAHREGVVHRDLKPHNVFIVRRDDDGGEVVKVLDFGISKIRGSQTVKTQDSTILGTPQYMAPEQAIGNHAAVDARTDVFALGAIVYEMLAGRAAFVGQNIPEVVFKVVYEAPPPLAELAPGAPARVVRAVEQALAKKQEERFPDVTSFVEDLAGMSISTLRRQGSLAGPAPVAAPGADPLAATVDSGRRERESIPAPPEVAATPARTELVAPRKRRRWIAPVAIGAICVAAGVGVIIAQAQGPAAEATRPAPLPSPALAEQKETAESTPSPPEPPPQQSSASSSPPSAPLRFKKDGTAEAAAEESESESDLRGLPQNAAADLDDAHVALKTGDYDQAIFLANRARVEGAGQRGRAVITKALCAQGFHDRALGHFRALRGVRVRASVREFCRRHGGYTLPD